MGWAENCLKDIKGTHHKRKNINKLNSVKMCNFCALKYTV